MNYKNNIFLSALSNYDLWSYMAQTKIRIRFFRTILGPIWEIIGTLVFIIFISLVWAKLWNKEFIDFFLYVYPGFIIWRIISTIITDSTYLFSETYSHTFENIRINPFILCIASVYKNLIILAINIPIILTVLWFAKGINLISLFYIAFYLVLLFITATSLSFVCASLCVKFRDIQFTIVILMQLIFFITPVLWETAQLSEKINNLIVLPNPVYHYIEFFRSALLNNVINQFSLIYVLTFTTLSFLISLFVYSKIKNKIIFWIS